MLLMGDEVRRTQNGNNNAYCQNNEISWLDWSLLKRHGDIHRFVKSLIDAIQFGRGAMLEDTRLSLNQLLRRAGIEWHGVMLNQPDWSEDSHSIAFTLHLTPARFLIHGMLNAYWEALSFELPPVPDGQQPWRRWIDTARVAHDDISTWDDATAITQPRYIVQPRSSVLLALRLENAPATH